MKFDRDKMYMCQKKKGTFNRQKARQYCCQINCCHLTVALKPPNELIQLTIQKTFLPATKAV